MAAAAPQQQSAISALIKQLSQVRNLDDQSVDCMDPHWTHVYDSILESGHVAVLVISSSIEEEPLLSAGLSRAAKQLGAGICRA